MKRYVIAAAAVVVVAAVALVIFTRSGSSAEVVATVNGAEIDITMVQGLVHESTPTLEGESFLQILDVLVQWKAVEDAALAEFGIELADDEIDAEIDRIYELEGAGATFEDFRRVQNVSEDGIRLYAEQSLIGEKVLEQLTENLEQPSAAEAQQLLADDPKNWTEVCSAHILVETEEEADAVLERLANEEDFAALAIELSNDTGSGAAGGDLGCSVPARFVEEFADATLTAAIDEVVGPVQTQFGFHLIKVASRTEATIEELQVGLYDQKVSTAVGEWLLATVGAADVTVDEEYGTWQTEPRPGIVRLAS